MELEILISKKGTKVVRATNLYQVLRLPASQYSRNVKKWFGDIYEFHDGIRRPVEMQDYAKRTHREGLLKDYYLSVELAKLITLNSESRFKRKYANHLLGLEDQVENAELMTKDQVLAVLELSKVMGMLSCQLAAERGHMEVYNEENGSAANWWAHRSGLLGYTPSDLKERFRSIGKKVRGRSQRDLLLQLDKYETIRAGVIDLFMSLGKSETFARNLGDLAKVFSRELGLEVWDDRESSVLFRESLNEELAQHVRSRKKEKLMEVWSS